MFKLPAETEFLSSFECSIITPSTSQSPRAAKGDKGVMYVLKYAFAFIGSDQSKRVTWLTDAMAVQELVVEGLNGIEMNTADGSKITINCMKERDEVFDNMIAMLEMMPVTDEPTPAMDAVPNGPPLKIGFQPESYVFLHLIDVSVEGPAAKMAGTPVTTVLSARRRISCTRASPVHGFGACAQTSAGGHLLGVHARIRQHTCRFSCTTTLVISREAMLPIASLPRDTKSRRGARFAVCRTSAPAREINPACRVCLAHLEERRAGDRGDQRPAWIGTSSKRRVWELKSQTKA